MKRKVALFALVAVAAVLVPVLAVLAQAPAQISQPYFNSAPAPSCPSATCGTCSKAKETAGGNDKVIDELTAILKDTKSPETFLLTAMTLGRLGGEAKRALPAIIRNAERLELLEGLCDTNASADNREAAQVVCDAIEMIVDKKGGSKRPARMQQAIVATPPPICLPAQQATSYGAATMSAPAVPGAITPVTPAPSYAPAPSCCPAPLASPPSAPSQPAKPKKGAEDRY